MLPSRRWLHHTTPDWLKANEEVFFVTVCCAERGVNSLATSEVGIGLLNAVKHYHIAGKWWVHLVLMMPDHMHALISTPVDGVGLKKQVEYWKRYTARSYGVVW